MTEKSPTEVTPSGEVFVSYASQDAPVANAIAEALEGQGIRCWIAPRDVTPGAHYADEIIGAISGAKALVLVLSDSALASKHVSKEVERASSKGRPIIALRLGKAPLTPALEYFLSESQWIDAPDGQVATALPKLIIAVQRLIHSAAEPTPAAAESSRGRNPVDTPSSSGARWSKLSGPKIAVLALILAAALAYVAVPKFWPSNHAIPAAVSRAGTPYVPISSKSIAVLPFVDMSEKHDQEYFSDGLSEELIDHLAHIPDLKVIARTSSFAFKGKNEDMRSIAAKLGVANLLEGSVRKSGGELRITAQLIRASDGVHLWSEIYDRKLTDVFKVQDEISRTVAKALNAALSTAPVADGKPAVKGTGNIEAYNLLLQGNYYYARSGEGDFVRAIGLYQQALKMDPHYALAWAKLALTYGWQGSYGGISGAEAQAKGLDAVDQALAMDPNCAEAYFARGNILRLIAGEWAAAKSAYARAVNLDPLGEIGTFAQGYILDLSDAMSGQSGDFINWANRRLERDPLDTDTMDELAWHQLFAGQLDESVATGRRQLELNPVYDTAQSRNGYALLLMGKKTEALAVAEKEPNVASRLTSLACIFWTMSRRADSDAALNELEHKYSDLNEFQIAAVHAWRGETDAAFSWLDRVYQRRRGTLEYMKIEPALRNLHSDPRFDELLRKVKLIE